MKKVVEFLMQAFFALFIMGVLVMLCGIGEWCFPLLIIGGITAVVGFVLSVVFAAIGEGIENKNR
jgi:hypothetical protein